MVIWLGKTNIQGSHILERKILVND